jgi:hypothetical protein
MRLFSPALWEGIVNGNCTTLSTDYFPFSFKHPAWIEKWRT